MISPKTGTENAKESKKVGKMRGIFNILMHAKKKSSGHCFITKNVAVIVLKGWDEWAQQKVDLKI